MKITTKLPIAFLSITIFVLVVGLFSVHQSQRMLEKAIGNSASHLVEESLNRLDMIINSRIESLYYFFEDQQIKNIITSSNREFEEKIDAKGFISDQDKIWTSVKKTTITPFMQELLDNSLSHNLMQLMSSLKNRHGYEVFGEIFVTNKYGANIAISNKTFLLLSGR